MTDNINKYMQRCYYVLDNSFYTVLRGYKSKSIHVCYYTTLLKSVQITRKTSTNIQRYSDCWLFLYFRFDDFVFSQSNFVSGAVLHVFIIELSTFQSFFIYRIPFSKPVDISKFLYRIPFSKAVV